MTLPQYITITPSPIPSVPAWVLVCYDFDQGATSPVILELTFTGAPWGYRVEVSKDEPCVRVYVPAGTQSLFVVDTSRQSADQAAQVVPD